MNISRICHDRIWFVCLQLSRIWRNFSAVWIVNMKHFLVIPIRRMIFPVGILSIERARTKIDFLEFCQKINKYLKTSSRTLSLPIGEVMLNRKGQSVDEDSSPTFLPFFCVSKRIKSSLSDCLTFSMFDWELYRWMKHLSHFP